MDIKKLLRTVIEKKASDLHIIVGVPPHLRINGNLVPVEGAKIVTNDEVKDLIFPLLTQWDFCLDILFLSYLTALLDIFYR